MSIISGGTFSSGGYGFAARVLIMAAATIVAAYILPGVHVATLWAAIATALVIALLDNFVRPILLVITLPISILSLGLFVFVVNTIIVMMASGLLGERFQVDGWGSGLLFSLLLTLFDYLVELPARRKQLAYDKSRDENTQDDDDEYTPYEEVND